MGLGITANQLEADVVVFFKSRHEFSNAEILALLNGGTEQLLPAPGENKAYCILAVILTADCTGGAYTFTGNAQMSVYSDIGLTALTGGDFREGANSYPLFLNGGTENITASLRGEWYDGGDGSPTENFANRALLLNQVTALTDVGGGNAANTLIVTVLYTIIDV